MSSGNKRVSQLVKLTASEVSFDDLFLIIDFSAAESKKISIQDIGIYLNASGSIFAYHSIISDTASYIRATGVDGTVLSSSYSVKSSISDSSLVSLNSITSSYANTSSWAINSLNVGGGTTLYTGSTYPITSSWTEKTVFSNSSSYLIYSGFPNGTSSYALSTQNTYHATISDTASFVNISGKVPSSSWADNSINSINSINSQTSSYLVYNGFPNGTSSYALASARVGVTGIIDYGIFNATTQSISSSQLDKVDIFPGLGQPVSTNVEIVGTIIIPFTSSIPVDETLYLRIKDRNLGTEITVDSTPIYVNISPTVGNWDSFNSGTIKIPYTLFGNENLYGSYMMYVTASSNKIRIEPNRINKFSISSYSENASVSSGELLVFSVDSPNFLIEFTSSAGGPFYDYVPGILITGSNNIFELNFISAPVVTSVRNVWTLNNLTTFRCVNGSLMFLSGFSNSLTYLDINHNSLPLLFDLSNTSLVYLDCSSNILSNIQNLPSTIQYLDVSNNPITTLPNPLPSSLSTLCFNNTLVPPLFISYPSSIVSMSFYNNANMNFFGGNLPSNLVNLDCHGTPIQNLPTIPSSVLNLTASNCNLTQTSMYNICNDLVNNGLYTGSLNIIGNGIPQISTQGIIITLLNRDWSVLYDLV
jgi:hypothetical protein